MNRYFIVIVFALVWLPFSFACVEKPLCEKWADTRCFWREIYLNGGSFVVGKVDSIVYSSTYDDEIDNYKRVLLAYVSNVKGERKNYSESLVLVFGTVDTGCFSQRVNITKGAEYIFHVLRGAVSQGELPIDVMDRIAKSYRDRVYRVVGEEHLYNDSERLFDFILDTTAACIKVPVNSARCLKSELDDLD